MLVNNEVQANNSENTAVIASGVAVNAPNSNPLISHKTNEVKEDATVSEVNNISDVKPKLQNDEDNNNNSSNAK